MINIYMSFHSSKPLPPAINFNKSTISMNKPVNLITLLVLACSFLGAPALAADYLTVTEDKATIKTGPGKNHPVSMELFQGYPLKVISKEGDWYKVSDFEQDTGWIHQGLVKKCDTVIVISNKSVNMRTEPSTNAPVIADVERGVVLTKIGSKDKWTQVRHSGGSIGWIFTPLLWP
jgi:SH3-like domain-containing protein